MHPFLPHPDDSNPGEDPRRRPENSFRNRPDERTRNRPPTDRGDCVHKLWVLLLLLALLPVTGSVLWAAPAGEYIVQFSRTTADPRATAASLGRHFQVEVTHVYERSFYGCALKGLTPKQARRLHGQPQVARLERSAALSVRAVESQVGAPWNLDRLDQRLPTPDGHFRYDAPDAGATVYILDTGIRADHRELAGRVEHGIDCTGEGVLDGHGHGTHVAGVVGGQTYGVAKGARLVSVKVLDSRGVGSTSSLLCGIEWITRQVEEREAGAGAAVAVAALGGSGGETLATALAKSAATGVFYALAAGDEAGCLVRRLPGVLRVGATDRDDRNVLGASAACTDLFAPGIGIRSAWGSGPTALTEASGSSLAAAHVAGAAALLGDRGAADRARDLAASLRHMATRGRVLDPGDAPNLLLSILPRRPVVIDEIRPATARVGDLLSISGRGFGAYQPGTSRVVLTDGVREFPAPLPYLWSDGLIQVRVPAGTRVAGDAVALRPGGLAVQVWADGQASGFGGLEVLAAAGGTLAFRQRTRVVDGLEVSDTLARPEVNGDPAHNLGRTKDAEVADVDGDGYPDLLDNNSHNWTNRTHSILRTNNRDFTFTSRWLEPLSSADSGIFAAAIDAGGSYFGNGISYDADFVDVDRDGYPDLLQTATVRGVNSLRLLLNNRPAPGRFLEASHRLPALDSAHCPDDLAHGDWNGDGWPDFALTLRRYGACTGVEGPSETRVFLNRGAAQPGYFDLGATLTAPAEGSTHDVFFLDANGDGAPDLLLVNEFGTPAQLYLHDGNLAQPAWLPSADFPSFDGFAGEAGDFNGDGLMDFALAGSHKAAVFLNDPARPGSFAEIPLPGPHAFGAYDVELGDLDLDGDLDIVLAAIVTRADQAVGIFLNEGDGRFISWTAGQAADRLPGLAPVQRLSADLLDVDQDGDLDLYLTGGDSQSVGGGFGDVPNQLFENLLR